LNSQVLLHLGITLKSIFQIGYQKNGYGSCEGNSGSPVAQFEYLTSSESSGGQYIQVRVSLTVLATQILLLQCTIL